MRLLMLVNSCLEIGAKQTTLRLVDVALRRGHSVLLAGVVDLSAGPDGGVLANARDLTGCHYQSDQELARAIATCEPQRLRLDGVDGMLIRTNPGRDKDHIAFHDAALALAARAQQQGVRVWNDPVGLQRASTKLYLLDLPSHVRPKTLVSADADELTAFFRELDGPGVLKPVRGSRGSDVFMIQSADDPNLRQIEDVIIRGGFAMAQAFVPEATEGDTRVLVLEGKLLEVEGRPGAFRRVPSGSDFRSNIDVGGKTVQAAIAPAVRAAVKDVGPTLSRDGLFFVGLDFIGDKIVEVNAFSPGGLRAARKFERVDFTSHVFERFEARMDAP